MNRAERRKLQIEIQVYNAKRDEILISGDVDRMIAFLHEHSPRFKGFSNRVTAEACLHKARTGVKSIPMELRLQSKRWLREHGSPSLDDGDLTDG
jgi:hypothetical protein